jgi:mono/diheme cytochrome c family protein
MAVPPYDDMSGSSARVEAGRYQSPNGWPSSVASRTLALGRLSPETAPMRDDSAFAVARLADSKDPEDAVRKAVARGALGGPDHCAACHSRVGGRPDPRAYPGW